MTYFSCFFLSTIKFFRKMRFGCFISFSFPRFVCPFRSFVRSFFNSFERCAPLVIQLGYKSIKVRAICTEEKNFNIKKYIFNASLYRLAIWLHKIAIIQIIFKDRWDREWSMGWVIKTFIRFCNVTKVNWRMKARCNENYSYKMKYQLAVSKANF